WRSTGGARSNSTVASDGPSGAALREASGPVTTRMLKPSEGSLFETGGSSCVGITRDWPATSGGAPDSLGNTGDTGPGNALTPGTFKEMKGKVPMAAFPGSDAVVIDAGTVTS